MSCSHIEPVKATSFIRTWASWECLINSVICTHFLNTFFIHSQSKWRNGADHSLVVAQMSLSVCCFSHLLWWELWVPFHSLLCLPLKHTGEQGTLQAHVCLDVSVCLLRSTSNVYGLDLCLCLFRRPHVCLLSGMGIWIFLIEANPKMLLMLLYPHRWYQIKTLSVEQLGP